VLQRNLLPKWSYLTGKDYIFQQDNVTIHTSSSTKTLFSHNHINVSGRDTCSPHIHLIENLCGIIVRKIYRLDGQIITYSSKADLKETILETWKNLEVDILKTIVKSMTERCIFWKDKEVKLTIRFGYNLFILKVSLSFCHLCFDIYSN